MADEMTLKQFVESTWFKGLARGAMVALPLAGSYVGFTLANVQSRVGAVEMTVAAISTTQTSRAVDSERFQALITSEVRSVDANVDGLGDKLAEVQLTMARMAGVLEEMQRKDVAERTGLRIP